MQDVYGDLISVLSRASFTFGVYSFVEKLWRETVTDLLFLPSHS